LLGNGRLARAQPEAQEQSMFVLAGAAASVLEHLGSLAASSALRASPHGKAGQQFNIGALTPNPPAGNGSATGSWSSSETMATLLSLQGEAGKADATGAGSANLLTSLFQHAQSSVATAAGRALSTFV
jgi:hypothetical protein